MISCNRLRRRPPWFALLFLPGGLVLASLLATCVILMRYSFNRWDVAQTMVPAWTLANYVRLVTDPVVARALVTTMRISLIVTLACLVLGYPVAYGIARSPRRHHLTFLLITPMLMDVLIRAYGWIVMLGQDGVVNRLMTGLGLWTTPRRLVFTEFSVVLEMIHELIPFTVLPIANVLEGIDPQLREAAMNLRAGPIRSFLHVILPLSLPGIVAGTLLTFALAMSAFVAPLVLGGGNVMTLTMLMRQSMFTTLDWPLGSAESILLVLIVLAMLALYRGQLRRAGGVAS
jgi:putative spermidine/putrescine transport system permease protein